ncbi:Cytochrome P450 9e2 [Harpegnathos saltator]|uniref:Cytochrome P450 9e2 n=1 Tax=Harpegnathos saltator TaxID=610380 RepID=E2C996_HARSA|nr:Cytochrome P450 9e2 [Harpegnathos saltator]
MEPTVLLIAVFMVCFCLYNIMKMTRFEKVNVPHERPYFFLGNMAPFFFQRMSMMENMERLYKRFPNTKYYGFYNFMTPTFIIRDPELITSVAIKNFNNFCDHNSFVNKELDPMASRNIFSLRGDRWREMRKIISPAFSSTKMKMMFQLMCECADNFSNHMVNNKVNTTVNVKEEMSKYTNDVVATCAFGINVDSFKYPNNEFYVMGRNCNRKLLTPNDRSKVEQLTSTCLMRSHAETSIFNPRHSVCKPQLASCAFALKSVA